MSGVYFPYWMVDWRGDAAMEAEATKVRTWRTGDTEYTETQFYRCLLYTSGDFIVNEKDKVVNLTEEGVKKVEKFFHIENLADPENLEIQHNIIPVSYTHLDVYKRQGIR